VDPNQVLDAIVPAQAPKLAADVAVREAVLFALEMVMEGWEHVEQAAGLHDRADAVVGQPFQVCLSGFDVLLDHGPAPQPTKSFLADIPFILVPQFTQTRIVQSRNLMQHGVEVSRSGFWHTRDQKVIAAGALSETRDEWKAPGEVDLLLGDATKARERLGWRAETSFEELVKLMVDNDWMLAREERVLAAHSGG
jgi:GDP-D-mannose dehydratase